MTKRTRAYVLLTIFTASLIVVNIPISPAYAATVSGYTTIRKVFFPIDGDEYETAEPYIKDPLPGTNILIGTTDTYGVGYNCDSEQVDEYGGPVCEQYFLATASSFSQDGVRLYNTLTYTTDGGYSVSQILLQQDGSFTEIANGGGQRDITVRDPESIAATLQEFNASNTAENGGDEDEEKQVTCNSVGPIAWFLCYLTKALYWAVSAFYNTFILNYLVTDPLDTTSTSGSALYAAWNGFRIVARILFVMVFMIAVIGQTFSWFFTAYELKKIIPRLIFGVIALELSWYFMGFMIDFFNILGAGVRDLLLAPVKNAGAVAFDFGQSWNDLLTGQLGIGLVKDAAVGGTIAVTGTTAVYILGGLRGLLMLAPLLLFSALMLILLTGLVFILRRMLILVLVVTSPIAMVAWILPGTQGITKTWWGLFWKALVMYPLIIGLIAGGEFVAAISQNSGLPATYATLVATGALFAPYVLIPQTFNFAGNILASASNSFQTLRTGMGQRIFGDVRDPNSWRGRRRGYGQRYRRQKRDDAVRNYSKPDGGHASPASGAKAGYRKSRSSGRGRTRSAVTGGLGGVAMGTLGAFAGRFGEHPSVGMARQTQDAEQWLKQAGAIGAEPLLAQLGFTKNPFVGHYDEDGNWQANDIPEQYLTEARLGGRQNDVARNTQAFATLLKKAYTEGNMGRLMQGFVETDSMTDSQKEGVWAYGSYSMREDGHFDMIHRSWRDWQGHDPRDGEMPHMAVGEEMEKFLRLTQDELPSRGIEQQQPSFYGALTDSRSNYNLLSDNAKGHYDATETIIKRDVRNNNMNLKNSFQQLLRAGGDLSNMPPYMRQQFDENEDMQQMFGRVQAAYKQRVPDGAQANRELETNAFNEAYEKAAVESGYRNGDHMGIMIGPQFGYSSNESRDALSHYYDLVKPVEVPLEGEVLQPPLDFGNDGGDNGGA